MASSYNELFGLGSHSEDANMEAWWPCQDDAASTVVDDQSSNSRNIALNLYDSSVYSTTGPNSWLSKAFDFPNSALYYGNTNNATLIALPQTYDMTVLCRCLPVAVATADAVWSFDGTDDLVLYPNNSNSQTGGARLFWRDLNGFPGDGEGGSDISGSWCDYAFITRASNDHEVYRDGTSVITFSDTGSAGPFSLFRIGIFSTQSFYGKACDYSLWSRALSAGEMSQWRAGPELNYSSGVSFADNGAYNVGTWSLPAPFASGSNGSATYEVVAVTAAGTVLDSATASSGTLDLSANAGNTCYLLVRASNTGGYDIGDKATRSSSYGSSNDGYYEIASVTAASGSIIPQVMHHRRLMGVS